MQQRRARHIDDLAVCMTLKTASNRVRSSRHVSELIVGRPSSAQDSVKDVDNLPEVVVVQLESIPSLFELFVDARTIVPEDGVARQHSFENEQRQTLVD